MSLSIGDFRTRRKVTAKFYFADETTPTSYRDYGNVLLLKQEPKIDRAQQMTASKGYVQITHEEPSKVDLRWQIKADEHTDDLIGLLHLADVPVAANQSSATTTAWSLSGVKQGYSYFVGYMGITAFTVTSKTLSTDYTYDAASGMLYVVPGGNIADNANIAGTVSAPAISFNQFTTLSKTFKRGYVRLITFDQNYTAPREVVTFHCELSTTDWGESDGQKFKEVSLQLLAIDQPVVISQE